MDPKDLRCQVWRPGSHVQGFKRFGPASYHSGQAHVPALRVPEEAGAKMVGRGRLGEEHAEAEGVFGTKKLWSVG